MRARISIISIRIICAITSRRCSGPTLADIDLDLKAFEERVNSHLVGKWVNIASRTAGFVHKFFDGELADALAGRRTRAL